MLKLIISLLGCLIAALGVNIGFIPVHLFSTAITGLGVLALYVFSISAGLVVFLLNVPLFLLAWKHFGRVFFLKNIVITFALSLSLDLLYPLRNLVHPPLWLGIIIGGALMGIGTGIIFRQGLTSGGVGLLARLIQLRFPNLKMGTIHIAFDFLVLFIGALLLDIMTAFYTFLGSIIMGRMMDITKSFSNPFINKKNKSVDQPI